jgi:hypothetical protein
MNRKRILELADFFYRSNSVDDVPLRICCETGQFTGFDMGPEAFIRLMEILNQSKNLKEDLDSFIGWVNEPK